MRFTPALLLLLVGCGGTDDPTRLMTVPMLVEFAHSGFIHDAVQEFNRRGADVAGDELADLIHRGSVTQQRQALGLLAMLFLDGDYVVRSRRAILAQLGSEHDRVRVASAGAALQVAVHCGPDAITEDAVDELIQTLESGAEGCCSAALPLSLLGERALRAVPALLDAARSTVRGRLLVALALMRIRANDAGTLQFVVDSLGSTDAAVRASVVNNLAADAAWLPIAIPELFEFATKLDENPEDRARALLAFAQRPSSEGRARRAFDLALELRSSVSGDDASGLCTAFGLLGARFPTHESLDQCLVFLERIATKSYDTTALVALARIALVGGESRDTLRMAARIDEAMRDWQIMDWLDPGEFELFRVGEALCALHPDTIDSSRVVETLETELGLLGEPEINDPWDRSVATYRQMIERWRALAADQK